MIKKQEKWYFDFKKINIEIEILLPLKSVSQQIIQNTKME